MCKRVCKQIIKGLIYFIKQSWISCLSLVKMVLRCDFSLYNSINEYPGKNSLLHILGNGSSLNEVLNNLESTKADYMVVNRHVLHESFEVIQPKYYVLADSHFFSHPEGLSILQQIIYKTSWDMYLYIPISVGKPKVNIHNPHIKLRWYNTFHFDGFISWQTYLYTHNLSMPIVQNVLVAAIYIAVCKRFECVELYGVEHSWTKFLFVDEENDVCLYNSHFFDKGDIDYQKVKDIQHEDFTIGKLLHCYAQMFDSYWDVQAFAKREKVRVINKAKGSFIDAFERG